MREVRMGKERKAPPLTDRLVDTLMVWKTGRICRRALTMPMTGEEYAKERARAATAYEQRRETIKVTTKSWDELRDGRVRCTPDTLLVPDERLIDKEVYEGEYGGDLVHGYGRVISGVRFTSTEATGGLRIDIETLQDGQVTSKTVMPSKNRPLVVEIEDKTITILHSGSTNSVVAERVYIKVE